MQSPSSSPPNPSPGIDLDQVPALSKASVPSGSDSDFDECDFEGIDFEQIPHLTANSAQPATSTPPTSPVNHEEPTPPHPAGNQLPQAPPPSAVHDAHQIPSRDQSPSSSPDHPSRGINVDAISQLLANHPQSGSGNPHANVGIDPQLTLKSPEGSQETPNSSPLLTAIPKAQVSPPPPYQPSQQGTQMSTQNLYSDTTLLPDELWMKDADARMQALGEINTEVDGADLQRMEDSSDPSVWEELRNVATLGWFKIPFELTERHPLSRSISREQVEFLVREFTQQGSTRAEVRAVYGLAVANSVEPWVAARRGAAPSILDVVKLPPFFSATVKVLMGNHRNHAAHEYAQTRLARGWWVFEVVSPAIYAFSPQLIRSIALTDNLQDVKLEPSYSEVAASLLPLVHKRYQGHHEDVTQEVVALLKQHKITSKVMEKDVMLTYVCRFPALVEILAALIEGPAGDQWRPHLENIVKTIGAARAPTYWTYLLFEALRHVTLCSTLRIDIDYEELIRFHPLQKPPGMIMVEHLEAISAHADTTGARQLFRELGICRPFREEMEQDFDCFPALLFPKSFMGSTWVTRTAKGVVEVYRILLYLFHGHKKFLDVHKSRHRTFPCAADGSPDLAVISGSWLRDCWPQYHQIDVDLRFVENKSVEAMGEITRMVVRFMEVFWPTLQKKMAEVTLNGKFWIKPEMSAEDVAQVWNKFFDELFRYHEAAFNLLDTLGAPRGGTMKPSLPGFPVRFPKLSPAELQEVREARRERRAHQEEDARVQLEESLAMFKMLVRKDKERLKNLEEQVVAAGLQGKDNAEAVAQAGHRPLMEQVAKEIKHNQRRAMETRKTLKMQAAGLTRVVTGADNEDEMEDEEGIDVVPSRSVSPLVNTPSQEVDDDQDDLVVVEDPSVLLNQTAVSSFGIDKALAETVMGILAAFGANKQRTLAQASREDLQRALEQVAANLGPRKAASASTSTTANYPRPKLKRKRTETVEGDEDEDEELVQAASVTSKKARGTQPTVSSDEDEEEDEDEEMIQAASVMSKKARGKQPMSKPLVSSSEEDVDEDEE